MPWLSLTTIIFFVCAGLYLDAQITHNFFPNDPSGSIKITATSAPGTTPESLRQQMQQLSSFYKAAPVKSYSMRTDLDTDTGQLSGSLFIEYQSDYLHHIQETTNEINQYIKQHHINNMTATMGNFLNSGSDYDVYLAIFGDASQKTLNTTARRLDERLDNSPIFSFTDHSIAPSFKRLTFDINNTTAAQFGLYRSDISTLLSTYYGGYQLANNLIIDGLSVPVVLQLDKESLQSPRSIDKLLVQSPTTQQYYPFNKFITLKMKAQPANISTIDGMPSISLRANLAKGYTIADAINFIDQQMAQMAPTLSYQYQGAAKDYLEGNTQSILIFGLGVICIYLLLAVIFDSLIDPFIILLTVPFSLIGGAFSLWLFGDSLNVFSTLALITLVGLITKHGILIVQFANAEMTKGATKRQAILSATHDRFRPIMMTTLAMTLGALPLLLNPGVMYVARRDLGMVLISGLIIGTLFSLFVVPLAYTFIKRTKLD